jgi:transposase
VDFRSVICLYGFSGFPCARRRVVDAIEGGLSTRRAATQFSIGISTAGSWHRHWRDTGSYDARKQGKPQGSILDEHGSFLMGLIEERADITLSEMVGRLEAERSLRVDPSTIWYFLDRNDITFKKRQRMPVSKLDQMS